MDLHKKWEILIFHKLSIVGKQIGQCFLALRDVPAVRKRQVKTVILLTVNLKIK